MKRFKKIISVLIVFALVISSIQTVFANTSQINTNTIISVKDANGTPGSMVNVDIVIENNPGILGAILKLSYDSGLTLVDVKSGEAFSALVMTKPGKFTSPCNFIWDGQSISSDDIKDGTIITLYFMISEDISTGESLDINISYEDGDFVDNDLQPINLKVQSGSVSVVDYTPGDLNDDGKINTTDVVLLRRYIAGGYGINIIESAADVNNDGRINTTDVVLLRRYIAGGYGVELVPSQARCDHTLVDVPEKEASCLEEGNIAYWHCTKCDKIYSDNKGTKEIALEKTVVNAKGHTVVVDPAVEPTYTSTGLTEGSHCSVCNKVLIVQKEIPKLQRNEYSITYHTSNNDSYLSQLVIENNNPMNYASEDGLVLQDLIVPGYNFKGWYTAQTGGTRIDEIPANSTGNKVFYAQWEKVEYTINFDSPDVPWDNITYTVDKGATLTNPSWFGYTFVGWSNDNGFIVSSVKPGTTGNITLHANWTSNRNKATSYSNYGEPIIIEDDNTGQFLFVYNIGKIENVPLSQIEYIGNTQSLNIDKEYEITDTITSDKAETVANAISNATTRSSGWTLSEEWNKIYEAGSEYQDTKVKTEQRTDSEGNTIGGNYFVSNSSGGSSYVSTESGGSDYSSSKVTTDTSKGINTSYDKSTEKYVDAKLSAEVSSEVNAGISFPVDIFDVSLGVKNTATIGGELASGRKDNEAFHVDTSESSYVGTVNVNNESSYYNIGVNTSSTWNSTSGYEKSYQTSRNTEISEAISEEISKTTSYNLSDSLGGANSKTESVAGTDTRKDEYSTTLKYTEGTATTTRKHISYTSDRPGYYRLVTAGTVHVYGVVGYDVATASYYTYTYNVLDNERHEYLDYSKDNANFNDCENGVVTFEVPYEVNEYILGVTGKTKGLEFDLNGAVMGFEEPESFDGTVALPQYYSVNNGDGTYSAYKTTKFDSKAFKGNTKIKTVVLPIYITEIPDNAFEGCTNLERVIAYGVTKIGNHAFKGCTALDKFSIDNLITSLGDNAFENVREIAVMASNSNVADSTINSEAKRITLNISKMCDEYDNKKVQVSEKIDYFAFISDGSEYSNLHIESNSGETLISNVKFVYNSDTPLKLDSNIVSLSRVSVENSSGFSLILLSDNTELNLFGNIKLSSKGDNTVISKGVSLSKSNSEVSSSLSVTGNYLICGEVSNDRLLSITDGELISIDADKFNNMLTASIITFDTNGGDANETSRVVYYGQHYGELPVPTREYYTFDGWYTAATGGKQITSDSIVDIFANQTLYAHWTKNTYAVTFNANGGTVSEGTRLVACGEKIGELPTPTLDYYNFLGWYTDLEGTVQITEDTYQSGAKDLTAYALWEKKAVVEWTVASEVPTDAKIVSRKWTYILTTNTESKSTSLAGYTQTGSYWVQSGSGSANYASFPSGFNTSHSIYTSFAKSAYSAYENTTNKRVVSNSWAGYVYWHWMYNTGNANGTSTRAIYNKNGTGPTNGFGYNLFGAFTSTNGNYSSDTSYCNNLGMRNYIIPERTAFADCQGATRWFRFDYYRSSYTDYYKMFKYSKTEELESDTEVTASSTISNVQEWVQYIPR